MGTGLLFVNHCDQNGDEFCNHIIIWNASCISHYTPETKQHSKSPTKPNILVNSSNSKNHGLGCLGKERHPVNLIIVL